MEKEDLPLLADWLNNTMVIGEFNPLRQKSKTEVEKDFEKKVFEQTEFIIEKKDGTKIGYIWQRARVERTKDTDEDSLRARVLKSFFI